MVISKRLDCAFLDLGREKSSDIIFYKKVRIFFFFFVRMFFLKHKKLMKTMKNIENLIFMGIAKTL